MARAKEKANGRKAIRYYVLLVLLGLVALHIALFFNLYAILKNVF